MAFSGGKGGVQVGFGLDVAASATVHVSIQIDSVAAPGEGVGGIVERVAKRWRVRGRDECEWLASGIVVAIDLNAGCTPHCEDSR